jgi:hypothetical protein
MTTPSDAPTTPDGAIQAQASPSRSVADLENLLHRVRGEFIEMPGLRLTEAQARRLWDLDAAICAWLLETLVNARFLFRTPDGSLMRADHASPARATLGRGGRRRVA